MEDHVKTMLTSQMEKLKGREEKMDENREEHGKLFSKMNSLAEDVAALKVKSGIWGFIAGAIPTAATFMYLYVKGKV